VKISWPIKGPVNTSRTLGKSEIKMQQISTLQNRKNRMQRK